MQERMDPRTPDSEKFAKRTVGLILFLSFVVPSILLGLGFVQGWREPATWILVAIAVALSFAVIVTGLLLSRLMRALNIASSGNADMAAILDRDQDALLLEAGADQPAYANKSMRSLLSIGEDADSSLSGLLALGGEVSSSVESLSAGDGHGARIVTIADVTYEISVNSVDAVRRLWRLHRLDNRETGLDLWRDRIEAHGRSSSAGLYTLAADGRFLYVNPTMAAWMGRDIETIVGSGLRIGDVLVKDSLDDSMRPGVGMISINGSGDRIHDLQISNALVNENDEARIYGAARPVGPAGSAAQRFQRLFQEMPVGVALVDRRLRIGDCNQTFEQLISDSSVTGRAVLDYVSESEQAVIAGELQSILQGESAAKSLEVRIKGPSEAVTSIFAGKLQDDLGRPTGLVLLVIDNTEQKMLETQLAQSQKMQAVGQLAGGIAHDFNNVLTAMIGFCDLLLQRHRPGDQSFADIMQIKQNANRAAALVRQLLAFSRQQTLQPRLLNVTEVLAELSNLLRRLLGEKTELSMVHGRDLGLVKGDQGQLEQVIINLAVNARDAMGGGGTLTIETKNAVTTQAHQAHGEVMPAGEYVQISVRDTGMGIPKENFARIFEPFFTTKEVGSGTGLGLSTVYGIIKQTGGYLFVDSPGEGKGTVFDIFLGRQQATASMAADGVPDDVASDLTGGGTVLLVEDEDPVRLFSARALRNKGYKVIEAKTGEAALELLDGGPYDLLVTDMVMPRVDGAQVIREARKLLPGLPVICISGYTEESVLKEVESLDRLRFLSKPFSLKQLARAVKDAIEKNPQTSGADGQ
ncbi:MAG: response regulator [Alphaproteobacteria bacterium]|nr:response regulator [Alphaproteobacteria bacterium]